MSTYVKLTVCRRQGDPSEDLSNHLLRSQALHEALDGDPAWKVLDWGETDDSGPHEWVDLGINFQEIASSLAPLAVPALLYVGKVLLETGISMGVAKGVERLLVKIRRKQDEGQIRDGIVSLLNETKVICHPGGGITISVLTSVSIPNDAHPDQIKGLDGTTESIKVPSALAPLVRQLIDKSKTN